MGSLRRPRGKQPKETATVEPMRAPPAVARVTPVSQRDAGRRPSESGDGSGAEGASTPPPSSSSSVRRKSTTIPPTRLRSQQSDEASSTSEVPSTQQPPPSTLPSAAAVPPTSINIPAMGFFVDADDGFGKPVVDAGSVSNTPSTATAAAPTPPAAAFSLDNAKLSDMEKKKQEMIMRQLKRREAQELKRIQREAEAAEKRQEEAQKQEELEAKKAAEKAKKEAIFQEYLKKHFCFIYLSSFQNLFLII